MEKNYNPAQFEEKIYQRWLDSNAFHAEVNPEKEPFCIVLPPPNITGRLHEGHALNHTLQDILIRYKRMKGYETLWLPGSDHASIATEVKILDRIRALEGREKSDLTREEFLEKAWAWKEEFGGQIVEQMKKLGNSCDWQRERFTMDEVCSKAVREVFVSLYEEKLIYQGERLINWCPDCRTSLSDAEVNHEDVEGAFYTIAYPIENSQEKLLIATTRPETMLGDTAVAVHPEDPRYRDLIGKFAILPLVGRRIPIIADDYVDRELGTGALKVTPAHDPNDYAIGERHDLEIINIFNDKAEINEFGGVYQGLDRYAARKKVVEDLEREGFLQQVKKHEHSVGHCYRCHHAIEPRISKQWFVAMEDLAQEALKSVRSGEMAFVPKHYEKIYFHWLENIRDWCISRQLWWGHRIPAWYCEDCDEIMVTRENPTHCSKCGSSALTRDPDVLDTWFSSALWPFSTLGWPEKTAELDYFYPTNVLVTGYDIIFFWVARMMFMGLKFMKEKPFDITLINGIVRDALGRKISKSLNNGTDPLAIIEEYGADALRFMLISGTAAGNDTRFSVERVEKARNFANKLWNAARFVLRDLPEEFEVARDQTLTLSDRWILTELNHTIQEVSDNLERYELGMAVDTALEFSWNKFCDWYIELSKKRLYSEDDDVKRQVQSVLVQVLEDVLKLLHPFMPFITEEIWQHLPKRQQDLIVTPWPEARDVDGAGLEDMQLVMESIRRIRALRLDMEVPPSRKSRLYIKAQEDLQVRLLQQGDAYLALAGISEVLPYQTEIDKASHLLIGGAEFIMPLGDLIDFKIELQRLEKEYEKVQGEKKRAQGKLSNPGFVDKAPASLVQKEREKLQNFEQLLEELSGKIAEVKELLS